MRHADEPLLAAVDALAGLEAHAASRPGEVRLERSGSNARILLDNPAAHNAMTITMMRQLGEVVVQLHAFEGSFITVSSAHGGSFCSGGHLGQVRQTLILPEAAAVMTGAMATILNALRYLPAISVSLIEGPAIGGGAEITTATDLRVCGPAGAVHFAQVGLGVGCGWGGAGRLVDQIGRSRALAVLTRSERCGAERALELGLVDRVVSGSPQQMLDAVLGPAVAHSSAALQAAKRQVLSSADDAAQAEAFLSVWGGRAHRRALGLTGPTTSEASDQQG